MLAIRRYFYSGWAWLIPYLAAYLVYANLKWPISPDSDGQQATVPCLLHVYWAFHTLHVGLGIAALRAWWRSSLLNRLPSTLLWGVAPWLCLAAIFWIPGLYLEWPSDPWEHLRRINEWHARDIVTAHSYWTKSSYFLPYSLTGHATGTVQLRWLTLYHTGVCLLLSWQYYRLARAVGLSERASFVFVFLNALTFGNNIFSFYRYYSLSSTIYTQLGAIAATRIVLEALKPGSRSPSSPFDRQFVACPVESTASTLALVTLIAFNHIQGLGIAGIGICAVIVWRLVEWKRAMLLWLGSAAVVLSAIVILWFPRPLALDEIYRPQSWLTAWYGFDIFSWDSPAFARSLQIVGLFGVMNLLAGIWLLRRNHIIGWLTVLPPLVVVLPGFSLPFASALVARSNSPDDIMMFHRLFLAVPNGLAVAAVCMTAFSRSKVVTCQSANNAFRPFSLSFRTPAAFLFTTLLLAVVLHPGYPAYNRFWHCVQSTPSDLQLQHFAALPDSVRLTQPEREKRLTVTSSLGAAVIDSFQGSAQLTGLRRIFAPTISDELERNLMRRCFWLSVLRPLAGSEPTAFLPDFSVWVLTSHAPAVAKAIERPATGAPSWTALGGYAPISAIADGSLLISNAPGRSSHVFQSKFIPVDQKERYQLTCTLRQSGSSSARNYLAASWYDKDGRLLQSDLPPPQGAGSPSGWSNGTYSYYGLLDEPAPPVWTTYSIAFGLGEAAAIPPHAAFIRIGALLNYNSAPDALIQIREITVRQKPPYARVLLVLPALYNLYSPGSISAHLSSHWSPQKAAQDHAELAELRHAAVGAD